MERGAPTWPVGDPGVTPVEGGELGNEVQADAGAWLRASQRVAPLDERLEDRGLQVVGHTRTVILDGYGPGFVVLV